MSVNIADHIQTNAARPHITLLYGLPGIGKTTFASMAPNPLFLMTEDGLVTEHLRQFPYLATKGRRVIQSYDEMLGWLGALTEDAAGYKTIVIDSLTAFEELAVKKVTSEANVKAIGDISHGRGYDQLDKSFESFMAAIYNLMEKQQVSIIILSHSEVKQVSMPDSEPYDRYQPALAKRIWPIVTRKCDNVLFAHTTVSTKKAEGGFTEKYKAVGEGERKLFCVQRGTHVAKNRCDMPAYIPMDFAEFAKYVPFMKVE